MVLLEETTTVGLLSPSDALGVTEGGLGGGGCRNRMDRARNKPPRLSLGAGSTGMTGFVFGGGGFPARGTGSDPGALLRMLFWCVLEPSDGMRSVV